VIVKVGYAVGVCPRCGKTLRRKLPLNLAICDCYKYCPLCGAEMKPYMPDLSPHIYGIERTYELKGIPVNGQGWNVKTVFVCLNRSPPYYSNLRPVEVKLK